MTTIAWDGETLCADRMSCSGNTKREVQKAWRVKSATTSAVENQFGFRKIVLFAWSGEYQDALAVRDFINGDRHELPKIEDHESCGLIITEDKQALRLEWRLLPSPIKERFYALGSGRDFAIGAMYYGLTAEQGVRVALDYDVYTGLGVDILPFEGAIK